MRYVYGWFKSYDKAADYLEHMWAAGDVGSLEQPKIERRGKAYIITLNG
jgi:hypothetical protein